MDSSVIALVVGGVVAAVQGMLTYLMKRSIDGLDKSIDGLSKEVKALSELHIAIARLDERVKALEAGSK